LQRINGELTITATLSAPLMTLLGLLASRHPTIFFKPLFTLSSSTNETVVQTALSIILSLSAVLGPSHYLLRDAEMMVVALLADMGAAKGKGTEDGWERCKAGQLALLVEMILVLRSVRTEESTVSWLLCEEEYAS
jgi:hypothetical protein